MGKIVLEENVLYLNEEEMIEEFKERGVPQREISRIILHEKDHIKKGIELGYKFSQYYLRTRVYKDYIDFTAGVIFTKRPKPIDVIQICMAPKKPSVGDIKKSKRYIKNIKYFNTKP